MNKCNVPKEKVLVLSNNKFSQRVTTNDNEWQRMTVVQRMNTTQCTSKNG